MGKILTSALALLALVFFSCISGYAQIVSTYAGNGGHGSNTGDGGQATAAQLDYPTQVAFDKFGNLFVSTGIVGHTVRRIAPDGVITTVAGTNGTNGYSGDGGLAIRALLNGPLGLVVDDSDNLIICDAYNNRVRKVDARTGIISTVAGTGVGLYGGDGGPATAAGLFVPNFINIDKMGNLLVSEFHRVRKISAGGIITTIAGNGISGVGDSGIAATSASIQGPAGVCSDEAGNVYFADNYARIFKVDNSGVISYFAGNGVSGSNGDGGNSTRRLSDLKVIV